MKKSTIYNERMIEVIERKGKNWVLVSKFDIIQIVKMYFFGQKNFHPFFQIVKITILVKIKIIKANFKYQFLLIKLVL